MQIFPSCSRQGLVAMQRWRGHAGEWSDLQSLCKARSSSWGGLAGFRQRSRTGWKQQPLWMPLCWFTSGGAFEIKKKGKKQKQKQNRIEGREEAGTREGKQKWWQISTVREEKRIEVEKMENFLQMAFEGLLLVGSPWKVLGRGRRSFQVRATERPNPAIPHTSLYWELFPSKILANSWACGLHTPSLWALVFILSMLCPWEIPGKPKLLRSRTLPHAPILTGCLVQIRTGWS